MKTSVAGTPGLLYAGAASDPLAVGARVPHPLPHMRRVTALLALAAAALAAAGCAVSSDTTWVHPDTGAVPARTAPDGR